MFFKLGVSGQEWIFVWINAVSFGMAKKQNEFNQITPGLWVDNKPVPVVGLNGECTYTKKYSVSKWTIQLPKISL